MKFIIKLVGLIALMGAFLYTAEAYLTGNYFRICVAFLCYIAAFLMIIQPEILKE